MPSGREVDPYSRPAVVAPFSQMFGLHNPASSFQRLQRPAAPRAMEQFTRVEERIRGDPR